jgi:parvulin-like peptidyl-prolyl isomerase
MVFLLLLLLVSCAHAKPAHDSLIFIDGIRAVFRGAQGIDLITESELQRNKLDGSPNTLPDMLTQLAFGQEAKRYHMWPSPEDVDKQLRSVAQANKLTPKDLDDLFYSYGYTQAEGRDAFGQMTAINNLINFRITSNLFVPEKDVVAYYTANPEYEEAAYYIQTSFVPFAAAQAKEQQLKSLQALASKKDPTHILNWNEPFWVQENELSENRKFITELRIGDISFPVLAAGGYELFRLLDKKEARMLSLEERYKSIVDILRRPKYSELMTSFQKQLLDNASITEFSHEKKGLSDENKIKSKGI